MSSYYLAGPVYLLNLLAMLLLAPTLIRLEAQDRTGVISDVKRLGVWLLAWLGLILILNILVDRGVAADYRTWDTVISVLSSIFITGLFVMM